MARSSPRTATALYKTYVPDPLGSTVALLNTSQTQTSTYSYWPYGEVNTSRGQNATPFQFVGTKGYYTDVTGRTYVRKRFLDTPTGRWLTQDPIGFDGEDANLYRYVRDNPVSITDPTGLTSVNGTVQRSTVALRNTTPPIGPPWPPFGPPSVCNAEPLRPCQDCCRNWGLFLKGLCAVCLLPFGNPGTYQKCLSDAFDAYLQCLRGCPGVLPR